MTYGRFRTIEQRWRPRNLAELDVANATRTAKRSRHDRDYCHAASGKNSAALSAKSHAGAGEDIVVARQKAVQVSQKLRGLRLTKAVELMEKALEETLTYYAFPEEHWRPIRTNTTRAHSA